MACLAEHMADLGPSCRKQVLRVYELQSDDYHMDRPLYYACQDDRENLCAEVKAGNGAVFQCLFDHLGQSDLSGKVSHCDTSFHLGQRLMEKTSNAKYKPQ